MTATQVAAEPQLNTPASIRQIIQDACDRGASVVYLQMGRPPFYRINGEMLPQGHFSTVTVDLFQHYLQEVLSPQQIQHYATTRKLDSDVRIQGFMQGRVICAPTAQGTDSLRLYSIALDEPDAEVLKHGTVRGMVEDAFKQKASDIHLQVGEAPRFRIQGKMVLQESYGRVAIAQFDDFLAELLTPAQREKFQVSQELDTAVLYDGLVRCRVNCAQSMMGGSMVLRLISLNVPTLKKDEPKPIPN